MTNQEIIFVTSFKNIGRENWNCYNLSNGRYIDYFYTLVNNIKYKLVVYLENDIKEIVIKNKTFSENIQFEDLNRVDTFYNKYIENDKIIITSDIYKNKIPDYRQKLPEHLYSEYNLINHSKINFVRHTKELYPNYLYYAWIDFGRMNESIENIPKNIDMSLLPTDKIVYHFIEDPPLQRIDENAMLCSNYVYMLGSSFIVPNKLVENFESIWEKKLIDWQNKYITDDDQNLVLQLYFDNPELFSKIKNEKWYNMYSNLIKYDIKNTVIPKIIFQTSVNKPESYVIEKLLSKCDSYKYLHFTDDDIILFFQDNYIDEFKNIIEKFHSIKNGAHKADLFRYYFLYINGGVYIDTDAMIEIDIKDIILDNSFFSILSSHHQCGSTICNAFIGASPKNDIIYRALVDVYNISNDALSGFYHVLCKNLFDIVNNNKYDFTYKLYKEESWENVIVRGYDYCKIYNENNEIVMIHYCIDKKIPK